MRKNKHKMSGVTIIPNTDKAKTIFIPYHMTKRTKKKDAQSYEYPEEDWESWRGQKPGRHMRTRTNLDVFGNEDVIYSEAQDEWYPRSKRYRDELKKLSVDYVG